MYSAQRTRTYWDKVFNSATAWGGVTEVAPKLPGPVRNLEASFLTTISAAQAWISVNWDPPNTGGPVTGYSVSGPRDSYDGVSTGFNASVYPEGTYRWTVTATNASASVSSESVTLILTGNE